MSKQFSIGGVNYPLVFNLGSQHEAAKLFGVKKISELPAALDSVSEVEAATILIYAGISGHFFSKEQTLPIEISLEAISKIIKAYTSLNEVTWVYEELANQIKGEGGGTEPAGETLP